MLICLLSVCSAQMCVVLDNEQLCGMNFNAAINNKPVKTGSSIEVTEGLWTREDSEYLCTLTDVIGSFKFANQVTFPDSTLLGTFEGFQCDVFEIDSKNCTDMSDECFHNSKVKKFIAPHMDHIAFRCFFRAELEECYAPLVHESGRASFAYCSNLVNVTVGTFSYVDHYTFYLCRELVNLEISFTEGTVIDEYAFELCMKLPTIDFSNITTLNSYSFGSCNSFTEIVLHGNTHIGNGTFRYCRSVTRVIADEVTFIGEEAFMYCTNLERISMRSVETLPFACFSACARLTDMFIPNVTVVGDDCFENCHGLSNLNYGFVDIGENAFSYCPFISTVIFDQAVRIGYGCFRGVNHLDYVSLASLTNCSEKLFHSTSVINISAPSLKIIPKKWFYSATSLSAIDLRSCEEIGDYAFEYASATRADLRLSLPNLKRVGAGAFHDTSGIGLYDLGTLDYVGNFAFDSMEEIRLEVREGDMLNIREYGNGSFRNITWKDIPKLNFSCIEKINGTFYCEEGKYVSIDMPNLVEIIGFPFVNMTTLEKITAESLTSCTNGIARNCSVLRDLIVPNLEYIAEGFLTLCPMITELEFHNLRECGPRAFMNMEIMKSISILMCTTIGESAFAGCTNLVRLNSQEHGFVNLTMSENISLSVFQGCERIQHVIIRTDNVGAYLFDGCVSLKTVEGLETTAGTIEDYAFRGCASLEILTLTKVTRIHSLCFANCTKLVSVNLSSCVTIYEDGHFMNCVSLRHVDFSSLVSTRTTVSTIFSGCKSLEKIYFSDGLLGLSFASSVFSATGRENKTIGGVSVINIDICFRYDFTYDRVQKENGNSPVWNGISLVIPDNYGDICQEIKEDITSEPSKRVLLAAIVSGAGGTIIIGAVIVWGKKGANKCKECIDEYKKRKRDKARFHESLELSMTVIDDFG